MVWILAGLWALLAAGHGSARAQDAGASADAGPAVDAAAATGLVDFTDEEGLAGGEEMTSPPLEPIERESLLPDRYRGPADAGPAPVRPPASRGRGCAGCAVGSERAPGAWLLVIAFAAALRRRKSPPGIVI